MINCCTMDNMFEEFKCIFVLVCFEKFDINRLNRLIESFIIEQFNVFGKDFKGFDGGSVDKVLSVCLDRNMLRRAELTGFFERVNQWTVLYM